MTACQFTICQYPKESIRTRKPTPIIMIIMQRTTRKERKIEIINIPCSNFRLEGWYPLVFMSVSISLLVTSHNGTAPLLMRYHAHGSIRACKSSNKFLRIICSVGRRKIHGNVFLYAMGEISIFLYLRKHEHRRKL